MGVQENCRMQDSSTVLSGTFKSRKASSMYTCTCDPSDDQCGSYQCLRDTEDEEEGLTGEEVPQGEGGSSSVEPSVKVTVISPTSGLHSFMAPQFLYVSFALFCTIKPPDPERIG